MTGPMIEVEQVTKRFARILVLERIDLCANRGQIVALLGPTGPARPPSCGCSPLSSSRTGTGTGQCSRAGSSPSPVISRSASRSQPSGHFWREGLRPTGSGNQWHGRSGCSRSSSGLPWAFTEAAPPKPGAQRKPTHGHWDGKTTRGVNPTRVGSLTSLTPERLAWRRMLDAWSCTGEPE